MSVCPHRDAFIPLTLDLPPWQRVDTARWGEAAAFADRCLRGTERIVKQPPYWLHLGFHGNSIRINALSPECFGQGPRLRPMFFGIQR